MTTDTGRLLELAERCEQATGPDRELDAAIAVAALGFYIAEPRWVGSPIAYGYIDKDGSRVEPGYGGKQLIRALTESLDAAMSLVPEGYAWSLSKDRPYGPDGRADAVLNNTVFAKNAVIGQAKTPALALCAASLRARAASATGEGL